MLASLFFLEDPKKGKVGSGNIGKESVIEQGD